MALRTIRSILGFGRRWRAMAAGGALAVWLALPVDAGAAAAAIDARLEVRDPVVVGGLAVFLVVDKAATSAADAAAAGTKLLAEALADGTLKITEVDEGGSVPTLLAHNKGTTAVLAMAGDVVHGGKQDRVFAQDTLIPPSAEPQPIAVNCVEHSRWTESRGSVGFSYAGKSEVSLSKTLATERDQSATWAKVAELNAAKGQAPSTGTYRASLEASDAQVAAVVAKLAGVADARAVGVVVAVKGDLEAAEIYDNPGIFGRARTELLSSVVLDAIGRGVITADSPAPATAAAAKWVLDARTARESVLAAQPASAYINLENDATTTYELRDRDGKKLKQSIYKK